MLFPRTHSGVFFGFCVILFSKLVNVTWDDKKPFIQKFGTLSIPSYFQMWDLVNAALGSSMVIFSQFFYFLIFFPRIPYTGCRHITRFFSQNTFAEFFYTVLRWCFFYNNLVFPYFYIKFLASV